MSALDAGPDLACFGLVLATALAAALVAGVFVAVTSLFHFPAAEKSEQPAGRERRP